jgi:hypothetical protein
MIARLSNVVANPAEEQGAIWIVVASAATMSHFTGYATQLGSDSIFAGSCRGR